jgi:hypothetical protein
MALYRLGLALAVGLVGVGGCHNQQTKAPSGARPVVEISPDTTAVADVDPRATLALKQDLVTRFPQNSPSAVVEAGLVKEGYDCTPNPAARSERACLKVAREGGCEINTIVRSSPYAPEKAQVIKICEVGATAPTPAP